MGNGGNFEIPQEILAVLPSDPYEQLDLARRITAMAVAERLSKLEGETGKLRAKLAEKELVITELNDRVVDAENTLQETTARLSAALDEQSKLTNEKNLLVNTVKKLNRDVAKLETFKRTLMQSLQEDDDGGHKSEYGGHSSSVAALVASEAKRTSSDSWANNRANLWNGDNDSETQNQGPPAPADVIAAGNQDVKHLEVDVPIKQSSNSYSTPPLPPQTYAPPQPQTYAPPQPTSQPPPVEPSRWQSAGSPERASPQESSKMPLPLSLPSSRSTTAPNSPPGISSTPGRTPRVDGKEFFRQARNRLSYEQFSAFLANIKELNAHRQTREETLRKADKTFGPENKDLYIAFDGLLSRHLST